jgi:hypothetical protein
MRGPHGVAARSAPRKNPKLNPASLNRLEHDYRDLSGRGPEVVPLPPWIRLEATGDMTLPLLALQLTGLHLDCRSFPGEHYSRMYEQVVVPAGIARSAIVRGHYDETITVRQAEHRHRARLSGASTSGRQHHDRYPRNPAEKVVCPRLSR